MRSNLRKICLAFLSLWFVFHEPQDLRNSKPLRYEETHVELAPSAPLTQPTQAAPQITPAPVVQEFHDKFVALNSDDWKTRGGSVEVVEGELRLRHSGGNGHVELYRTLAEAFEVRVPLRKMRRNLTLTLPDGASVVSGGYVLEVSLGVETVKYIGPYAPNEDQELVVQYLLDEIRVYVRRMSDSHWLHNDGHFRAEVGPCITQEHEASFDGKLSLQTTGHSDTHRIYSFHVTEPLDRGEETFFPLAGPVPSLADDGLTLPVLSPRFDHIGFGFRADGPRFPLDDPSLIPHVTISPFGPPADPDETGLLRGSYMLATIIDPPDKAAWEAYCADNGIDPEVGYVGDWHAPDDTGIGSWELASPELRAWIKQRVAERVASTPTYHFIFWDVCYPYTPDKYTVTEWADLQGTLYREIWKDVLQPAGWFHMLNVGNGKKARNLRICDWGRILYLDRQGGQHWQWHEHVIEHNPKAKQAGLGDDWISVFDSQGGDRYSLSDDWKYGILTQFYQRLFHLGGWDNRHLFANGFNGDVKNSGGSGRQEWSARHWVPAALYDIGEPLSAPEMIDEGTSEFAGDSWSWRFYKAEFEGGTVYHFPLHINSAYESSDHLTAPGYTLNFDVPHDVLQFDGTWQTNQMSVNIPAGSGRIVRVSQ